MLKDDAAVSPEWGTSLTMVAAPACDDPIPAAAAAYESLAPDAAPEWSADFEVAVTVSLEWKQEDMNDEAAAETPWVAACRAATQPREGPG